MVKSLRSLLDPYIAVLFAVIGVAALFPATGRAAEIAGGAADIGIVFLFFLYGARLSPQAMIGGLTKWKLHIAVLLCTFALFPMLGLAIVPLLSGILPLGLVSGILYLCILPSTVQSSIAFTSIAQGNVPAAICAASLSNMLGVVVSPFLAALLLGAQHIELSPGMIGDIFLQLMAPFIAGQVLRPWIGRWLEGHKTLLGYADRGSILLIIYVAFSKGMADNIWSRVDIADLAILLAVLMVLLAVVLAITSLIGRHLMRLETEDAIVLQFCGSKKSLASGLPMATILFANAQLSMIILPLMLFHQIQLITCALLARRYANRAPSEAVEIPSQQKGAVIM